MNLTKKTLVVCQAWLDKPMFVCVCACASVRASRFVAHAGHGESMYTHVRAYTFMGACAGISMCL